MTPTCVPDEYGSKWIKVEFGSSLTGFADFPYISGLRRNVRGAP
jgi:hypothetical protein